MNLLKTGLCAFLLACCSVFSAQAIPVQWTLQNVTFDDGRTATGSFIFDEDTSAYSAVDIVTSGSNGARYTRVQSTSVLIGTGFTALSDTGGGSPTGETLLTLGFASPGLTDSSGSVILLQFVTIEEICRNPGCTGGATPFRQLIDSSAPTPSVSATPVPLPATAFLLGAGVLALFRIKRGSRLVM
ncbi:MAG: hypothetical protein AAGC79_04735 [Pseudomonadota bacterium]